MPLPDSDMRVPALLGMEYPDPMGSGLRVPVLGFQTDSFGTAIALAGTMEDPSGKGEIRHLTVWHVIYFINKHGLLLTCHASCHRINSNSLRLSNH